jgi:anti-sigma-K factor RskA
MADDETEGLAAEYVLGSLAPDERREVDARRRVDPALRAALEAWERRLGPLSDWVRALDPPAQAFEGIAARIWGEGPQGAITEGAITEGAITELALVRRSRARWRIAALGSAALAACLALSAGWLIQDHAARPTGFTGFVALLQKSASNAADEGAPSRALPAFLAVLELNEGTLVVSPVSARPTPRRSYELWLALKGASAPVSLGVIAQSGATRVPLQAPLATADLTNATLTVSLEPEGGSPSGQPTGPILFVGKLVPTRL